MSQIHLNDLRNELEKSSWRIAEELPGDGFAISATWLVEQPDGSSPFHIDFHCLDELQTLPIELAHACSVRENKQIGAFFARKERTWPDELAKFVNDLKSWAC